jgi:Tol biopolymer transport system component
LTNEPSPGAGASQTNPQAVFISYASEDTQSAVRIGASLQAAGIEVWLDKDVLRGGDAWDQKIRHQIRDCTLFIPLISANTEARTEGYFRLEWHLADQRTQLMARSRPFLLPVCIDDTAQKHAEVPDSFSLVQWIRLPAGETSVAFIGRVSQLLAAARQPAMPMSPGFARVAADDLATRASRGHRRGRVWVSVAGGILLLAGMTIWLAVSRGYFWHNPLANAQFSRLTDWSGTENAAAISRDGRTVAFIADHDGPNDVWVTETGSGRFRNMTHGAISDLADNPEIRTLGFSGDGSLITIWLRRSGGSHSGDISILAMPSGGGELRTYMRGVAEIAWSSDRRQIVYHTTGPGDPMFVADSAGGAAHRIYAAPAGVHCHFQVWSPDDAFIYFVRGVPTEGHWDLWRIRPSGTGLEQLTFHNSVVSHPVLLDVHTLLYLATDAQGAGPWLYAIDPKRRIPHRISFGLERYTSLAASADGARLAVTVAHPSFGLWHVALPADAQAATAPSPLSADLATGLSPRTGSSYVLYVSRQSGRPGIWKLANGARRELWTGPPTARVSAPAIARDGRIAFTVADGERSTLYVMQSDGSGPSMVADSFALRGDAAWAPDGKSVIVAALHEGEPRLMSFFPGGGAPVPLVYEYSLDPVWSPDGQFLLYSGADVGVTFPLRAVEPDGRPYPLPPVMLPRGSRRVVFNAEGHIVVLRGDFRHKDFWLVDLKAGSERRLTQFSSDFDIRDFDLSVDKSEILFDRVQESSTVALIDRAN